MLTEIVVDEAEDVLLLQLQVRRPVVRSARGLLVFAAAVIVLAPIAGGGIGLTAALVAAVLCVPLGVVLFLARFRTEWLVDRDGINAVDGDARRFIPFGDVRAFEYVPWTPSYDDVEPGHGGCIRVELTGRSLQGPNLQFGRGLPAADMTPILSRLQERLRHFRDAQTRDGSPS